MAVRTRQEYLKGLAANYTTNITPEAGSKLGKFKVATIIFCADHLITKQPQNFFACRILILF
jgi:hypothetical protein